MERISIVIPTYKRYESLNYLLSQLERYQQKINEIVVVDSTKPCDRRAVLTLNNLIYITTNHQNGLYQRFLGHKLTTSEIVLFLDNDMEIVNDRFIDIIVSCFKEYKLVGMALRFENKHSDTSLSRIPKSLINQENKLKKIINFLTGYPELEDGEYGLCGNRGKQPLKGGPTKWVSGGAFAAKRDSVFKNFNLQLCDLFEIGLGMGEDPLIGYCLSKVGLVYYNPYLLFYHNDRKDSSYSLDPYSYSQRVTYSRMFLAMDKARLDQLSLLYARIFYHWYTLCRLAGLSINYLLKPDKIRLKMLHGAWSGWKKTFRFKFDHQLSRNKFWEDVAKADIVQIK